MLELFKRLADLDPNFTYWERAGERGTEVVFPDGGYAYPSDLNEDGCFRFQRDEAHIIWYCVQRLAEMDYRLSVQPTMYGEYELTLMAEVFQGQGSPLGWHKYSRVPSVKEPTLIKAHILIYGFALIHAKHQNGLVASTKAGVAEPNAS